VCRLVVGVYECVFVCAGLCVQVQAWEVCSRSVCVRRQTHKEVYANTYSVAYVGHPHAVLPVANLAFFSPQGPIAPERGLAAVFI